MSKKSFTGGLNSLLGEGTPENKKDIAPVGKEELTMERAKAFLDELTKLTNEPERPKRGRAIAYWDRVLIKEVVNSALQEAVGRYEKKHGDIKPIPKK